MSDQSTQQAESTETSTEQSQELGQPVGHSIDIEPENTQPAIDETGGRSISDMAEMSDEEFLSLNDPNSFENTNSDGESTDNESTTGTDENAAGDEGNSQNQETQSNGDNGNAGDQSNSGQTEEQRENNDADDAESGDNQQSLSLDLTKLPSDVAKIFKPFKANGSDMRVENADEAIQLMQMGANYNKKMQQLGPHLRQVRTLEKAGIKPEDLNYLIDLHKKDPGAIKKLVADANIDPMDLDTDSDEVSQYRPNDHAISDKEMQVEAVLNQIESTPTYQRTVETVGKTWDDSSRAAFSENPQMLVRLNEHMQNGVFDKVSAEVNRQRSLGQLTGVDDLNAYQQMGEYLQQQGAFGNAGTESKGKDASQDDKTQQSSTNENAQRIVQTQTKRSGKDSNLNARRRAASPTRSASTSTSTGNNRNKGPSVAEMAALSDDEFEKRYGNLVH